MNSKAKIEFGDFQTPLPLARQICAFLAQCGVIPDVVLEPTCGIGSFLVAGAENFPQARLFGWDINPDYVKRTRDSLQAAGASGRAVLTAQDFFKHNWESELAGLNGQLLVLGNLPWVTNAAVSSLHGANVPMKENFQGFRGLDARTGKSNFDISEWMLIQLIKATRGRAVTIAMICKTATARKLLRFAWQNDGRIAASSLHYIDAKKHFGASVDASLLVVGTGAPGLPETPIFDDLHNKVPLRTIGLAGQDLVSDVHLYRRLQHLEGLCPYQWRSGVKHDCSSIMELRRGDGSLLCNKLGEQLDLETDYIFPLLKCSDLANGRTEPERCVLVTQTRVGEDTSGIAVKAPRTWSYLGSHRQLFDARKSSIYANQSPFAIFGIGEYSFAPWKVAVSGLHHAPRFMLTGSHGNKPVFFDDTCYFLPFQNNEEARIVTDILNSEPCMRFLSCLLFEDAKRPITVDLLQRLNLHAIADEAGLAKEWESIRKQRYFYPEPLEFQAEFIMERPK